MRFIFVTRSDFTMEAGAGNVLFLLMKPLLDRRSCKCQLV